MRQLNKKILNSTTIKIDNIKFKSKLESKCYLLLKNSKLNFDYECDKFILLDSIKLQRVKYYQSNKGGTKLETRKVLAITYTPDFKITYKNNIIYIDSKGFPNDTYPLKKKMFLNYLESLNDGNNYYFFEPHSLKEMHEVLSIISNL